MANLPKTSADTSSDETLAKNQAHARRERRDAKIKAGATNRLEKISRLSGRPADPAPFTSSTRPPSDTSKDPDEVDISNNPPHIPPPVLLQRQAQQSGNGPSETDLRVLHDSSNVTPVDPYSMLNSKADEDPMSYIVQQMMGSFGGNILNGPGSDSRNDSGIPPGRAARVSGGADSANTGPTPGQQNGPLESTSNSRWTFLHFIVFLSLAIYVLSTFPFTDSYLIRTHSSPFVHGSRSGYVFWLFSTVELSLQSTREFLKRGRALPTGTLGTMAGFLPQPWKEYVLVVGLYSRILMTVVQDAMLVVFIMGAWSWSIGVTT